MKARQLTHPASRYKPPPIADLSSRAARERLSPGALKAFFNIMARWKVRERITACEPRRRCSASTSRPGSRPSSRRAMPPKPKRRPCARASCPTRSTLPSGGVLLPVDLDGDGRIDLVYALPGPDRVTLALYASQGRSGYVERTSGDSARSTALRSRWWLIARSSSLVATRPSPRTRATSS